MAEPDARRTPTAAEIAAEEWDLLFRAALELLERVAVEKPAPCGTGLRPQALPATALLECLAALDQPRRSVPPAQPRQTRKTARAEGEATPLPPASRFDR